MLPPPPPPHYHKACLEEKTNLMMNFSRTKEKMRIYFGFRRLRLMSRRRRQWSSGGQHQLTLLFFTLSIFQVLPVGGRFGSPPTVMQIKDEQMMMSMSGGGGSSMLGTYSGPQPSEKFISCHFNNGCFCKYDQKTEIYDALRTLWQLVGFNETSFYRAVSVLQRDLRSDPTMYFFPESDVHKLAQLLVNSTQHSWSLHSYSSHHARPGLESGPIFEFVCLAVPLAVIPTEYSAHGLISHVSVTGSELGMLDGSAFAGLEIQNIQLSRDQLYFISEYAFSSMANSLTVLDISMNFFDEIPFHSFRYLKSLEWVNLGNNLLNSVEGEWFSVSESIRQLSLSGNSIDSLPHKMFSSFGRLVWLDLSSNLIRNISHEQLPPNLQTLILMKNRLQQFPIAVFHLDSLSWLILSACRINHIPTEWSKQMNLNQLDLTENFIQTWPTKPFAAHMSILDLVVSKNYVQVLPDGAFHSMDCYRLSLGYNRIHRIDTEAFITLESSLQYLNLENNNLPGIPWMALANLTSLMHLYVGSNHLTDENVGSPEVGKDCKLTYLGLNSNKLTRVPRKLLARCSNLRHLNLGYNQIAHLDDLMLLTTPIGSESISPGLKKLSTLVLRNNPIYSLAFSGTGTGSASHHLLHHHHPHQNQQHNHHSNIAMASVHNNNNGGIMDHSVESPGTAAYHVLPSIPNVFRTEAFPNLYELSLSFCQLSGELEPFPTLPLTNLEISMGLKSATTVTPQMFQHLKDLEWLALDHNSLQSISESSFYSNPNLTYVNLEWNRLSGTLPRQIFHPNIHKSISQVRLSHNKISSIASESFLSFPAINLDLSYNSIQVVEKRAFSIYPFPNNGNSESSSSSSSSENPNEISKSPQTGSLSAAAAASSSSSHPGLNLYLNRNRLTMMKPNALSAEKISLDISYNNLIVFNFDTFSRQTLLGGLNISHNEIQQIVVPKGRRFMLKFLDVSYNKVQYRSATGSLVSVCPTDLLDFSHNSLERTDVRLFPTNCSLRELNLNSNSITNLDPESFTNLRDLTILRLQNNQISFVPDILFIRNLKLNYLDLSHNKIRSLPRDALVGSSIEILKLSGNEFVNLPVGSLSQVGRTLRRLDISMNSLENLDSTMFETLNSIVHLNLSYNRLTILPDNSFANLASLLELDLSGNNLRCNFKELFHFLPKLAMLRLANCGIKQLPMLPLPHLISLDISQNLVNEIKMQSLNSLTKLRVLDISDNELKYTTLPSWTPLANLITLRISGNPLGRVNKDTFYGLSRLENLEMLDMGRMERFESLAGLVNLRTLAVETYPNIEKYRYRLGSVLSGIAHLEELRVEIKEPLLSDQLLGGIQPKLRKLTISGSNLKKIEPNALDGLENCFHMDLTISGTSIEDIPPRIFELLQNAEWARFDISGNRMSGLDSSALYPNRSVWFSKGTRLLQGGLILNGNEWICDCDLVWIGEWLRRWLRESFESHSTAIPLVHSMYEEIRRPTCVDPKGGGRSIPLIELYSDVMCHASALSKASSITTASMFTQPLWRISAVFILILWTIMMTVSSGSSALPSGWLLSATMLVDQPAVVVNSNAKHSKNSQR